MAQLPDKRRKRIVLIALEIAVLLAIAAAAAFASSGSNDGHGLTLRASSDTLEIGDSRSGAAILTSDSIAPNRNATGDVTITNSGTLPASLTLSQSNLTDEEGPNGGRLSEALNISVRDSAGSTFYTGKLTSMGSVDVGRLEPGQSRTYVLGTNFPDGGTPPSATTGDNAYSASASSLDFDWTAIEAPPLPAATPTPTPRTPSTPSTPGKVVLSLSGKGLQRVSSSRGAQFRVAANVDTDITTIGVVSKRYRGKKSRTLFKTKPINVHLQANEPSDLWIKFTTRQARVVKRTLRSHKPVYLTIKVVANGSNQSVVQEQARIRVRR